MTDMVELALLVEADRIEYGDDFVDLAIHVAQTTFYSYRQARETMIRHQRIAAGELTPVLTNEQRTAYYVHMANDGQVDPDKLQAMADGGVSAPRTETP